MDDTAIAPPASKTTPSNVAGPTANQEVIARPAEMEKLQVGTTPPQDMNNPGIASPASKTAPKNAAKTTPDEELAAKQAELEKAQVGITLLQDDIKALKANITDFVQTLAGYDTSYKAMIQELADLTGLINQKKEIADAVIKDNIAEIDKLVADFDKGLEQERLNVQQAETLSQSTSIAAKVANDLLRTKQDAYDSLKKSPKDAAAKLKEVRSVIDQANQMEAKGNYVVLHFLANEADALAKADEIKHLKSPPDFSKALEDTQNETEGARQDAAKKKNEAEQTLAAFVALNKNHEAAKASRRADLLKMLNDFKPAGA